MPLTSARLFSIRCLQLLAKGNRLGDLPVPRPRLRTARLSAGQQHQPASAQQRVGHRYRVVVVGADEHVVEDRGQYRGAVRPADPVNPMK